MVEAKELSFAGVISSIINRYKVGNVSWLANLAVHCLCITILLGLLAINYGKLSQLKKVFT